MSGTNVTTTANRSAPSSAGARAMRSSRARRRCSTRCCRASRSISPSRRPPTCARCLHGAEEVRLEIGFGGAEHLIDPGQGPSAHRLHRRRCLRQRHRQGARRHRADGLGNIRLHFGDAIELIDWLPAGSLARIDLLYPDPWPKRRHWKRRFIQDDNLARLARILQAAAANCASPPTSPTTRCMALARVLRSSDFVWTAERA